MKMNEAFRSVVKKIWRTQVRHKSGWYHNNTGCTSLVTRGLGTSIWLPARRTPIPHGAKTLQALENHVQPILHVTMNFPD